MENELKQYSRLLDEIKIRIRQAQVKAALSANAEMISMYWDIGCMILKQQQEAGWGSGVIPRLSKDIRSEVPELKGFSERNIKFMVQLYKKYALGAIGKQAVSQLDECAPENLQQAVAQIPWGHNILLMQRIKDLPSRLWYIQQTMENGWSRDVLGMMIKSRAHKRQGIAVDNFQENLPARQSDLAVQLLKDPYVFDFFTLEEPFRERELEAGLVQHLQKFLIELGQGFSFVGRQYHLDVGDEDFYIDLLFYHLKLRCFVVIDLKVGPFKPEYAGKMNFYCNVIDDRLRHESDNQTIGLVLCQDRKKVVAEYALRGMTQPIGISEYELTRALPESLKSSLPTIEEIEAEFSGDGGNSRE